MSNRLLLHNARIHTQASGQIVDSLAVNRGRIAALGNGLQHDPDFRSFPHLDLGGRCVLPGFVDAHTHFYYFARMFNQVRLDDANSITECLRRIEDRVVKLKKNAWVLGDGYSPDRFERRQEPTRAHLDRVCGGRPAFIFAKDMHSAWVNSKALEIAGISKKTQVSEGGEIVRDATGEPTGILRENAAYELVYKIIPPMSKAEVLRCYDQALQYAWSKGVTGVHSMDGPDGFAFFTERAERGKLGLRINYFAPCALLDKLEANGTSYGMGDDWLRVAGIKIFADGALGSQTGYCFSKYLGSKDNYGIEVTPLPELKRLIRCAAGLGLPCAVHAIGDRAVSNVLDAFEAVKPPRSGARHRIEHLQLVRRRDLGRVKRLGVIASVQPSHCTSDIGMVRKYWGSRGRNAYVFRTLLDKGIDVAFGSDVPIEPLDPIAGIAAAVRRARPGSRDVFCPEERITAADAVFGFTVGPAVAVGQAHCRGYLLPGYPADFIVLDRDITRIAPVRIYETHVLATVIDGKPVWADSSIGL